MTEDPQSETPKPSGPTSFWAELKRRKVMRVAITYAVVAWVIMQVAATTFASFGIPEWAFRFVVIMLCIFFPVAVILAWAFELTPDGIKTTKHAREEQGEVPLSENQERKRNRFTFLFGAAVPTLIFGALAIFFYFRANPPVTPDQGEGGSPPALSLSNGLQVEDLDKSIAVLPLINMSAEDDNRYFADGVHEDILTGLTGLEGFKVISRTTMLRYAVSDLTLSEIGKALNSQYVVEGSVRKIGNHVRITIQLIDAINDHHIWASNFDRELVDVFAVQSELAKEISNSIHLEIQPETVQELEGTLSKNPLAYDLYLKAQSIDKSEGETEDSMRRRLDLLERAVAADPGFVEAWGILKRDYDLMLNKRIPERAWFYDTPEERKEVEKDFSSKSARALSKAMILDPNNPEALLASIINHIEPQPPEVLAERKEIFERILAEHPNHAMTLINYGWWHIHITPRDPEAGKRYFDKALEMDPFNVRILEIVKTFYRINDWSTEFLDERLEQILPQDLEQRRLNSLSLYMRLGNLFEAFVDSADETLMEQYRTSFEKIGVDNFNHTHSYHSRKATLLEYDNNLDGLVQISNQLPIPDSFSEETCPGELADYCMITSTAMVAHYIREEPEEARNYAQRIIAADFQIQAIENVKENAPFVLDISEVSLSMAYSILGNEARAVEIAEKRSALVTEESDEDSLIPPLIAWTWADSDKASKLLFEYLENNPSLKLIDYVAADFLIFYPLLQEPAVKDALFQDGKWTHYLAERIPEYAELKNTAK
ncbi:MAG: hypothetical protein O3C43_05725 [Verrucomicrobia bacterium]|nr:hypothetical protein [Verrucomicrobiota bacterium]MDA1065983.1 hypothetical protein [Verrucomicrobiota bacterium]